jgi:hypothetical protein
MRGTSEMRYYSETSGGDSSFKLLSSVLLNSVLSMVDIGPSSSFPSASLPHGYQSKSLAFHCFILYSQPSPKFT